MDPMCSVSELLMRLVVVKQWKSDDCMLIPYKFLYTLHTQTQFVNKYSYSA